MHAAIETLGRLAEAFGERRGRLAASCGVTEPQWQILEKIATEHFMPSMFAKERESSAAAVSKVLRQLLDKGLVSVSVSPDDGRQRQYELTGPGRQVMSALRRRRQRAIEAIWGDLDPEHIEQFIRFGRELSDRLEHYRDP